VVVLMTMNEGKDVRVVLEPTEERVRETVNDQDEREFYCER